MALRRTVGGYYYLPGGEPYSAGVVADESHQIVRSLLRKPVPWRAGFDVIGEHLASIGRSRQALCGIELRSPGQVSFDGFREFNLDYRGVLGEWGLLGPDGSNPVARTNVVPLLTAPLEPSLYAFSYTIESDSPEGSPSFISSGAGELVDDALKADAIVRRADRSAEGMAQKMSHVLGTIGNRLRLLGGSWDRTTTIDVYTARMYPQEFLGATVESADQILLRGVHWYPALPPVEELEFEMDARGLCTEIVIG